MKILLDTCTFLWTISEPKSLSPSALKTLQNANNQLFLSPISLWEVLIKLGKGKLSINTGGLAVEDFLIQQRKLHGIESLLLNESSVKQLAKLPSLHQDPFDRMLICQAIANNMVLVTPDKYIQNYSLQTLW